MSQTTTTRFAPQLYIQPGITDVTFYEKAFGAVELRRFTNDDDTIHVVEFAIDGNLFHIHEEKLSAAEFSAERVKGTTVLIGLFVDDVDTVLANALAAGGTLIHPAESYDYGYRQAEVKDPFGHTWLIEMKI